MKLLGVNWAPGRQSPPLVTLSWAALGFGTGAMVGLRVMADAKRSFRARLIVAPFLLAALPAAAYLGGATGAAIGLAVVSCLTAVVWWAYYRMSVKASETDPRQRWMFPSPVADDPEPEPTLP